MNTAARKDPEISFGPGFEERGDTGPWAGLPELDAAVSAPPRQRDPMNSGRRSPDSVWLAGLRREVSACAETFDALARAMVASRESLGGAACMRAALDEMLSFDSLCDPSPTHPLILVGSTQRSRARVAGALALRLRHAGRKSETLTLETLSGSLRRLDGASRVAMPLASGASACIRRISGSSGRAIIDCDAAEFGAAELDLAIRLQVEARAEAVFVCDGERDDGGTDLERLRIRRFVAACRPDRHSFGPLLDLAHLRGWALGGMVARAGVFHPLDAPTLTERFLNAFGERD